MTYSNKYLTLLIIFLTFLISGCSPLKQSNAAQDIPSWYLNAPNNNTSYLYGTGQGDTVDESKNMALNNLASKLSVNVSSVISSYKSVTSSNNGNSDYSKDVSQDVSVEVEKMRFANYEVEKSIQQGNYFFTLVKVSRTKLFNEKYKEFELLDSAISKQLNIINNKPILEQIQALQNLYPKLNTAKKDAFILYTIKNNFDYAQNLMLYDNAIDKINILKDKITINVTTNEESKFFFNEIIQLLNENKYKVSNTNDDTQIKIKNVTRYSIAKSWHIAKVSTTLTSISNDKTIANTTINSVGRSTSSQENALASAALHFKKQVYDIGLENILFNQ